MVVVQAMVCHSFRGMFACVSVCGFGVWLIGWLVGWVGGVEKRGGV